MHSLRMPDINSVTIAGNLTSDPTLRQTTNGTPVANFYIASNRKFKDNSGQSRDTVCFVGVVAWYKLADSCHEHLKKGSAVLVEGELQSRTWKDEGGGHSNVVEIKARRIQFLNRLPRRDDLVDADDATGRNLGDGMVGESFVLDSEADLGEQDLCQDASSNKIMNYEAKEHRND